MGKTGGPYPTPPSKPSSQHHSGILFVLLESMWGTSHTGNSWAGAPTILSGVPVPPTETHTSVQRTWSKELQRGRVERPSPMYPVTYISSCSSCLAWPHANMAQPLLSSSLTPSGGARHAQGSGTHRPEASLGQKLRKGLQPKIHQKTTGSKGFSHPKREVREGTSRVQQWELPQENATLHTCTAATPVC